MTPALPLPAALAGPPHRDRLSQVRVSLTFVLRATNHAALALRAVGGAGRSPAWLAAGAGSIAADAVLARRLRDPGRQPDWTQRAVEWCDAALWAGATDRDDDVTSVLALALPGVMLAAFDAVAGVEAVPVYDADRPWPPAGAADGLRRIGRVAVAAGVPAAITTAVRRRRGLPTDLLTVAPALGFAGLVALAGRQRDRLHRAERRRWVDRSRTQVRQARVSARTTLAS
jgi:hypothetical protein